MVKEIPEMHVMNICHRERLFPFLLLVSLPHFNNQYSARLKIRIRSPVLMWMHSIPIPMPINSVCFPEIESYNWFPAESFVAPFIRWMKSFIILTVIGSGDADQSNGIPSEIFRHRTEQNSNSNYLPVQELPPFSRSSRRTVADEKQMEEAATTSTSLWTIRGLSCWLLWQVLSWAQ